MNCKKLAQKIEKHYLCHGVSLELILLETIGTCERFIFKIKLKPGTRENLIFDRAPDIKTALCMPLFQPFKDGLSICLAVSEQPVTQNSLWKMLTSQSFRSSRMWIPVALGYDMRNEMLFADLGRMPHAMYAGATNSGKSFGLLCLAMSIIFKQPVSNANLILFDVGANTMEPLIGIPHLSHPIVKDTETGLYVIQKLVEEMERRIKLDRSELRKLPALVCIIDEYISLINNIGSKKLSAELAAAISNLLRRGRHAKIHVVIAAQDPTVKNMKVDIGNITARMAFACATYHNSMTILGEGGADKLPGKGAMLYKSNEHPTPLHLQGAFMSSNDVKQLIARINSASHDLSNKFVIPELNTPQLLVQATETLDYESPNEDCGKKELADIIMWTLRRDNISANQIRDHFRMGNRSYGIVDKLFEMGIIEAKFANQPRKVIPQRIEDIPTETLEFMLSNNIFVNDIDAAITERCGV